MRFRLILMLLIMSCFGLANGQTKTGNAATDTSRIRPKKTDTVIVIRPDLDSTAKSKLPKPPYIHQFRLGFDISRIAFNIMYPSRQGYEIQADYALRGKLYLAAEAGIGKGTINYENLKYNNNGFFVKFGVDNSFLDILSSSDFDMAFLGARYGVGIGKRSEATYFVPSPFGPSVSGTVAPQNFMVHWGELTGGIKVEFWKGFFAGYNLRMRFMLNPGVFKELAPNYIPGYGKGDKSVTFDFNFYISYALRWGKI